MKVIDSECLSIWVTLSLVTVKWWHGKVLVVFIICQIQAKLTKFLINRTKMGLGLGAEQDVVSWWMSQCISKTLCD